MYWVLKKPRLHLDSSFEYLQHIFWLRNKQMSFNYALLPGA